MLIGTPNFFSTVGAFITKDSCMFLGKLPCLLGFNDGPFVNLVSTLFPFKKFNSGGMFNYDSYTPYYFQRGDTTFGQYHPILFVNAKDQVNNSVSIFPNPCSDRIFLRGIQTEKSKVSISNSLGEVVFKEEQFSNPAIDVSGFPIGIYFLQIESGTQRSFVKFLKN
jgi:hypothetical protein